MRRKYRSLILISTLAAFASLLLLDFYVLPEFNFKKLRNRGRPILMFTSDLLKYTDGGSRPYFGISYQILDYHEFAVEGTKKGTRIGPKLTYNFHLPFRNEEVKEDIRFSY